MTHSRTPTRMPSVFGAALVFVFLGGVATDSEAQTVVLPRDRASAAAAIRVASELGALGVAVRRAPALGAVSQTSDRGTLAATEIAAARAHYRKLELDQAVRRLEALENKLLPHLAIRERDAETRSLAEINLWLGVFLLARQDESAARERFLAALAFEPAQKADPAVFSPLVVSAFEKARASVPALGRGTLSVVVEPDPGRVFLDGRFVGRAPQTLELSDGVHVVGAELLGRQPFAARVRVAPQRIESQRIFLRPLAGSALDETIARAIDERSPDLESPAALASLGVVLGASRVVVVVQSESGLSVSAVDTASGKAITKGNHPDAAAAARSLVEPKRARPSPPSVAPVSRLGLRFSTGATKYLDAVDGVVMDILCIAVSVALSERVSLVAAVGVGYGVDSQLVSWEGVSAGDGVTADVRFTVPFQLGVAFDVVRERGWGFSLEGGATAAIFALRDPRKNGILESGSTDATAVGFRFAPTVDLRLHERWRLAFSLGYTVSVIVGGAISKVTPTSSPLHGFTLSLGLVGLL